MSESDKFDPKERAREKQLAREEDERLIREGKATAEEIFWRNAAFAFPKERLKIGRPKRFA